MIESAESKKLKSILEGITKKAEKTLRSATEMGAVQKAQGALEVVDQITTQFFKEVKQKYEQTKLEL